MSPNCPFLGEAKLPCESLTREPVYFTWSITIAAVITSFMAPWSELINFSALTRSDWRILYCYMVPDLSHRRAVPQWSVPSDVYTPLSWQCRALSLLHCPALWGTYLYLYFLPVSKKEMDLVSCAVSVKAVCLLSTSPQLIQKLLSHFTVTILARPGSEKRFASAEMATLGFRLPADIWEESGSQNYCVFS